MTSYTTLLLVLCLTPFACSTKQVSEAGNQRNTNNNFKVIGYYYHVPSGPGAKDLDLSGLTHINYSFAIPEKDGNGLEPLKTPKNLAELVDLAHSHNKKVFISLGGWNLGDGGGEVDDAQVPLGQANERSGWG